MSYDNSANAVRRLEERFERLLLILGDMQAAIGRLQQPSYNPAGSQSGGGGGGGIFIMAGQVIAAGASATGVTVDWVIGGTGIVASTTATVWNMMQSATVASKTIVLGANPDGSFTVISQSC